MKKMKKLIQKMKMLHGVKYISKRLKINKLKMKNFKRKTYKRKKI